LPRGIPLGNVETPCQLNEKIDTKDENETSSTENQEEIAISITNVEEKHKVPLIKLIEDFKDLFAITDSQLEYTELNLKDWLWSYVMHRKHFNDRYIAF
jgi:hypothetical protein